MAEKNISQELRLKVMKIILKNHFTEDIKQNEIINKKHKKICKILNYTEYLLIPASTVIECASISPL